MNTINSTSQNQVHKKKKVSALQIIRYILQFVCFVFIPSLYIGVLNGVKELYVAVIHQSFSMSLLPQAAEVIAIIPITILLGRFFCGWMCAFGSFTDFIYHVFHRFIPKKWKINANTDRVLKSVKYIILVGLIILVWSLNITVFNSLSPWDAFGMLITVGKMPDFSYVAANLTLGFSILILVLFASAVIERFFCRYLCPMGAVFALLSKLRVAKIKKPTAQCGACRMCTNNCAMGIPLYKMEKVSSSECINCMKCVTVCPRGNAEFSIAQNDVRPLIAGAATVAAISGIYFTANLAASAIPVSTASASQTAQSSSSNPIDENGVYQSGSEAQQNNSSQNTFTQPDQPSSSVTTAARYKDGTYQGTGTGFRGGNTEISVVVSGGKITQINVSSYGDDRQFFERAYSTVTEEIISNQSTSVDAVSGATYSSNGIMQAVADALSKAV